MASTFNRLCLTTARGPYRVRPRAAVRPRTQYLRLFHASQCHRAESSDPPSDPAEAPPVTTGHQRDSENEENALKELEEMHHQMDKSMITAQETDLEPRIRTEPELMSGDQLGIEVSQKSGELLEEQPQKLPESPLAQKRAAEYKDLLDAARADLERQKMPRRRRRFSQSASQVGLIAMGEHGEGEAAEDEVFEGDDITSLGHGHLEEHREIRHYMRIAAWEMPLLTQYAKEFVPPSTSQPLRFRYTSYMGETHPAEPKISLEFCTADLPLTPKQRLKLIKLVGPRYDPQKDLVRMSCEMFEHAAQNKRYLGDLVDTLMSEARNESTAEGGKDPFDDIPVDFRHVKWKDQPIFPETWKMTDERRDRLREGWRKELAADKATIRGIGTAVDGKKVIEEALKLERPFGRRQEETLPLPARNRTASSRIRG